LREIVLNGFGPRLRRRVVVGSRRLRGRTVAVLGRLRALRRFLALFERFVFGAALGGADHAHGELVLIAPLIEPLLVAPDIEARTRHRVDHVDRDMHMRVGRVGVLDDHDLMLFRFQELHGVERGFQHMRLGWVVIRMPFDGEAIDRLGILCLGRGQAGALLENVLGLGGDHHLPPRLMRVFRGQIEHIHEADAVRRFQRALVVEVVV
jgi:hypothetical protein